MNNNSFNMARGNILILIMIMFFLVSCAGTDNPNGDTNTNADTNFNTDTNTDTDTNTNTDPLPLPEIEEETNPIDNEEDNQDPIQMVGVVDQLFNQQIKVINQQLKLYAFFGKEYSFQPNFGLLSSQDGVSYVIQNKPTWATFDKSTGRLSGFPDQVGTFKNKMLIDRVAFNINIIASKDGKRVSTGLFNIITTNENKQNNNKVLVLSSQFSNSTSKPSIQEFSESYKRMNSLIISLSKGMQSIDATIINIEDLALTNLDIGAWETTSVFLELAYKQKLKKDSKAVCEVNEELMSLATSILKNMDEEEKLSSGIIISTLDFTFALDKNTKKPCAQASSGEIAVPKIRIPDNIDISQYDYVVAQLWDEELNVGSFQASTKILNIKQDDKSVRPFILAAVTKDTFNSKIVFAGFDENNFVQEFQYTYYDSNQEILRKFDRTVSHEFIHALRVNTHDNGLTSYIGKDSIAHNLKTGYSFSKFEYQNNFSTLGTADYSNGLALATREFLGWINLNDIYTITKTSLNNQIVDINSRNAKIGAKILTASGWLYVSFHTGTEYEAPIKHPKLINNTKGLLIEYTPLRRPTEALATDRSLTISTLLIPNKNASKHDYALKKGETFSLFGVTIDNILITNNKLSFDVKYADNFQDILKINFNLQ